MREHASLSLSPFDACRASRKEYLQKGTHPHTRTFSVQMFRRRRHRSNRASIVRDFAALVDQSSEDKSDVIDLIKPSNRHEYLARALRHTRCK